MWHSEVPAKVRVDAAQLVPTETLSIQSGAWVRRHDGGDVIKSGHRVRRSEELAMRLAQEHTSVPVPEIFYASYRADSGMIVTDYIEDRTLDEAWDTLPSDEVKTAICTEIWGLIAQLERIPKPESLAGVYSCLADGSPSNEEPLLRDLGPELGRPAQAIRSADEFRQRIYERYLHFNGRKYEHELLDMLPRPGKTEGDDWSEEAVFAHGDIAPRNLFIDESTYKISAVIDWESAGWYPPWWEYCQLMRPMHRCDDWREFMRKTAPREWDLQGIRASRVVLMWP